MVVFESERRKCVPEYIGQDLNVNHIFGKCKCGNGVVSYEHFCNYCGSELDWNPLKDELNKRGFKF